MMKMGFATLIALTSITSAATAECRTIGFRFYVTQNDSVSTTGVSTGGSACTMYFRSLNTVRYTSRAIASPPAHGSLSEVGAFRFRYRPSAGFKGVDRYAIRICGSGLSGSGCSTLTYNITVQ